MFFLLEKNIFICSLFSVISSLNEQRAVLKVCFLFGKCPVETVLIIFHFFINCLKGMRLTERKMCISLDSSQCHLYSLSEFYRLKHLEYYSSYHYHILIRLKSQHIIDYISHELPTLGANTKLKRIYHRWNWLNVCNSWKSFFCSKVGCSRKKKEKGKIILCCSCSLANI